MITVDCGGAQGKSVSIVQNPAYPYDIPVCGLVVDGKHVEQKVEKTEEVPPENPPEDDEGVEDGEITDNVQEGEEDGGETTDNAPDGARRRRMLSDDKLMD